MLLIEQILVFDLLGFDPTPTGPTSPPGESKPIRWCYQGLSKLSASSASNTSGHGASSSQPSQSSFLLNSYYGSSATINSEASAASSVGVEQVPDDLLIPWPPALSSPPPAGITLPQFNSIFPIWSSLLLAIFDTATTIALQTPTIGWLPDRVQGLSSPLNYTAMAAAEALVRAYVEDYRSSPPPESKQIFQIIGGNY
jgi:hypothetical protein